MSTTHLHPVPDTATDTPTRIGGSGLPDFEGQPVDFARLKLTSVADLEVNEEACRLDDVVRLYVEGQVVRVDHVLDERTGKLKRVHTIKVVDAVQLPWDFDTGAFDA